MKELQENQLEGIHEEYKREQEKRDIQRHMQLFDWSPTICGIGIVPLIVVTFLIKDMFGIPASVGFFFGGAGFLAGLTMIAILQRRRITENMEG